MQITRIHHTSYKTRNPHLVRHHLRNPPTPGAGQRPPELAGREKEVAAFDVVLERVARGRPERSLVLTGLRGVGKTVLLGELRSMAVRRGWGAGKIEARPDAGLRRPLSAALHRAVRDLAVRHRAPDRVEQVLGVLKAFALRASPDTPASPLDYATSATTSHAHSPLPATKS